MCFFLFYSMLTQQLIRFSSKYNIVGRGRKSGGSEGGGARVSTRLDLTAGREQDELIVLATTTHRANHLDVYQSVEYNIQGPKKNKIKTCQQIEIIHLINTMNWRKTTKCKITRRWKPFERRPLLIAIIILIFRCGVVEFNKMKTK